MNSIDIKNEKPSIGMLLFFIFTGLITPLGMVTSGIIAVFLAGFSISIFLIGLGVGLLLGALIEVQCCRGIFKGQSLEQ